MNFPSNVDSVNVTDSTETALTLQWNKVNNSNDYSYNLTYNSGTEISINASEGNDIATYTVSSLSPGTEYNFTLYTVFEDVRSSGYNFSNVTIPSNVDSVSVTDRTETALTLQWNKVNNSNEYSYTLTFSNGTEIPITASEGSDTVTYTVSSLSPGTKYTFTLYTVFEGVRSSGFNFSAVASCRMAMVLNQESTGPRDMLQCFSGCEEDFVQNMKQWDVLVKAQFIVQDESKVSEALYHVNSFIIDAGGAVGGVVGRAVCGSVNHQFFRLSYIYLQVIVRAPLCEVGDGVLIGRNRVIVNKENEYYSVIRVSEVCSDG
ncbi:fibronectin-like [Chanos chanos]|uniref:Fibronectin-like n=1 Tax=Chanos chanos TaxID=29144 RepID=A0A6J2UUW7_CHACN|nr:fibronectin-like [Chanos chanos]